MAVHRMETEDNLGPVTFVWKAQWKWLQERINKEGGIVHLQTPPKKVVICKSRNLNDFKKEKKLRSIYLQESSCLGFSRNNSASNAKKALLLLWPPETQKTTERRLSSEHGYELEQVPDASLSSSPLDSASRQRAARCFQHVFDSRLPAGPGGFSLGEQSSAHSAEAPRNKAI